MHRYLWAVLLLPGVCCGQSVRLAMETDDAVAGGTFVVASPGLFVYDPLTKTSSPNTRSLQLKAGDPLSMPGHGWAKTGSFTLEAFVRPTSAAEGPYVKKSRTGPAAAEAGLMLDYFSAHNQFYLKGFLTPSQSPHAVRPSVGYYGSPAQWQGEKDTAWRHLAVVYDAERKTMTVYVDYYLSKTQSLTDAVAFDDGPLLLGGGRIEGLLDEVRYTPQALGTPQFLRAVNTPQTGVSYVSQQTIAPRDANCLDVKEHFGAVGDGQTDDTDAFQRAFDALCSRVPLAYNTLLVPEGEYLISRTIQGGRFIDVQGAGPQRTRLTLKDGAFTDPTQPLPILRLSSSRGAPGSYQHVNGSSISIYLEGLTLDTGRNNPGARGLEYHSNNLGRLENVVIRSGDGAGVCGLDLTHHDCGPSLVKHVTIEGFDYGIQSRYQEYSMTFEHVTLRHQRKAGVLNQGNVLAFRKLTSNNRVPALVCDGANSMLTLLDSSLMGGSREHAAVQSQGAVYAARVATEGYQSAIAGSTLVDQKPPEWKAYEHVGPVLDEYCTRDTSRGFGDLDGALKLPIEETPEPPIPPVAEWVNVLKYEEQKQGDDWSPVVQAAIDSGARVLYVPANTRMGFDKPVYVHGKVERIVGYGGGWNWNESTYRDKHDRQQTDAAAAPPPLLIFDEPKASAVVVLSRLSVKCLSHQSPGTLVLRSSSPDRYVTGMAGGKLFAEDVGGADWHFDHPQQVWVRQWNPESHAAGPCIHSRGARIWALGFKTEYESQKWLAEGGAASEILGGLVYPIGKILENRPVFENRNSRMSLVYGVSVYHSNHKVHVRDVRGDVTRDYGNESLRWAGSRAKMELWSSDGR